MSEVKWISQERPAGLGIPSADWEQGERRNLKKGRNSSGTGFTKKINTKIK